jgi:hypothetical protein
VIASSEYISSHRTAYLESLGDKLGDIGSSSSPTGKTRNVSRVNWLLNSFVNRLALTGMSKTELEIN